VEKKFNNLFVKNLPKDYDEDKLRELFAGFGEIDSIAIPKDEQGNNKDFGYVCFKSNDDAEKAWDAMNKK
jgi:polyadenylate-binding protein